MLSGVVAPKNLEFTTLRSKCCLLASVPDCDVQQNEIISKNVNATDSSSKGHNFFLVFEEWKEKTQGQECPRALYFKFWSENPWV